MKKILNWIYSCGVALAASGKSAGRAISRNRAQEDRAALMRNWRAEKALSDRDRVVCLLKMPQDKFAVLRRFVPSVRGHDGSLREIYLPVERCWVDATGKDVFSDSRAANVWGLLTMKELGL